MKSVLWVMLKAPVRNLTVKNIDYF